MKSLFGNLFDLDHDGELNTFERTMEFEFLEELGRESEDPDEAEATELELSGLDPIELEFMDADERREALEDAGLDPDEYDF